MYESAEPDFTTVTRFFTETDAQGPENNHKQPLEGVKEQKEQIQSGTFPL